MKVNGIIAEYNPFHNGHQYQLMTARAQTGADYTVVVMSGDFTQRGEAAVLSKYARAEMALRCGADFILELPAFYAAGSAEFFAEGAVALLDKLGVVDYLCFGSECGDAEKLKEIAGILAQEPEGYKKAFQEKLAQGMNFPSARAFALREYQTDGILNAPGNIAGTEAEEILNAPNNILGIEYAKALLRRGSSIRLSTVRRKGSGYCQPNLEEPGKTYPSALAIRRALLARFPSGMKAAQDPGEKLLQGQMPQPAYLVLRRDMEKNFPVQNNDFSGILHYKLLSGEADGYEKYWDVSGELSCRIQKFLYQYRDFDSFCSALKTRDLTYTRVSRCLLHILLDITKDQLSRNRAMDWVPYARILGLRKSASPLLRAIKENSSIPMVGKLADASHILEGESLRMFKEEIRISHIYNSVSALKSGRPMRSEYATPIAVLP